MIKWVKFYTTGKADFQTLYTDTMFLQNDGETHEFTDATDAIARSTAEVFIFWDNKAIGQGAIAVEAETEVFVGASTVSEEETAA